MMPMRNDPAGDKGVVRWARNLAAAGLLIFLLAGLGTTLRDVLQHRLDVFPEPVTWSSFLTGRTTANVARAMASAPVPVAAARLQRGISWELLADLGPHVRTGCPGWLFIADELRVHPQRAKDLSARADVLARVHEALRARGIALLVVTVPDKSRIEASRLCGLARPTALDDRLRQWNELLLEHGIAHLDFQATLRDAQQRSGQPMFLRTDTHWNEAAAEAAAQTTAAAVRAQGVRPVPEQHWQVYRQAEQLGDLIRLAGLDRWQAKRPLQADHVQASHFKPVDADEAAPDDQELFGDADAPNIALIGTSFSNTSNFGRFLEQHLQVRLGRFAKDGGDFDGAAKAYFASDAFRQNPPRLLIWEVPERVLQLPDAHDHLSKLLKND